MSDSSSPSAASSPGRWQGKRHYALMLIAACVMVFAARARWFSDTSAAAPITSAMQSGNESPTKEPEPGLNAELTPAEQMRRSLLGRWRDQYYGERTMTFARDGTGTMLIKLDAVGQAIYGEKLLFHLAWKVRDGVLMMEFTGGEPQDAVATISKLWGAKHEQKIELLNGTDLHLRSTDSGNLYQLQRLE